MERGQSRCQRKTVQLLTQLLSLWHSAASAHGRACATAEVSQMQRSEIDNPKSYCMGNQGSQPIRIQKRHISIHWGTL
eukprot:1373728-Amphidinium_carterae.1